MTSSEKNKIYVDYYNMAKDWDMESLLRAHRQCCAFRDDVSFHQGDVYYRINNIHDRVICDLIYLRNPSLFADDDYVPYCVILGLDKVIGYEF